MLPRPPACCLPSLYSLGSAPVGVGGDSAGVSAVRKADVPGLAPRGPPRVAYLPRPLVRVDAHHLHGVVEVLAAVGEDAPRVRAPRRGVYHDGQGPRGLHVARHHVLVASLARRHVGVARGLHHELGFVGSARAGDAGCARGVRVVDVLLDAIFRVLVARLWLASCAAAYARDPVLGARADLLRAQDVLGVAFTQPVGLDLLRHGEGPARPAVALVLHGGGVDPCPVLHEQSALHRLWEADGGGAGDVVLGGHVVEVARLELLHGNIAELGDAVHGGPRLGGVARVDELEVLHEDAKSEFVLGVIFIQNLVLGLECLPHEQLARLRRGVVLSVSRASDKRDGEDNFARKHCLGFALL
mmetsp:Transcript_22611/g.44771  ORF Transcript_22611/g.44771 Transcript_22611/m.44771 type:complete len:357 (-) Transcript_22611:79-1149(-)